jgi:hypothetical protein
MLNKIYSSKYRISSQKIKDTRSIGMTWNVINSILKTNIKYKNKQDLQKLNDLHIKKIEKNLKLDKYQSVLKKIFRKDLDAISKKININALNYRISVQAKGKWNSDKVNRPRKVFYNKKGHMHEDKNNYNFNFPTRPHQDLNNNGFRSSSALISYITLTPSFEDSSLLEIGKFTNKAKLLKFSNKNNYENEIIDTEAKKTTWIVPKSLKPGSILFMDTFTIHRSSSSSLNVNTPRLALNIKIQPNNLDYIFKKFGFHKIKDLKTITKKLAIIAKKINSFNYELAITYYLLEDFSKSKKAIKKIFAYNVDDTTIKKFIAGGFLRKDLRSLNNSDYKKVFKSSLPVEKLSCADAILNSIS